MKTTLLAAAAAFSLVAATGQAASGGGGRFGDPFPFRAPGVTVAVNPSAYADTGSIAYPDLAGRPSQVVTLGGSNGVPMTGSQGGVETANSLPRGFQEGTIAYAQERSVQRYLAQQTTRAAQAIRTAQVPSGKPRG